MGSHGRKGGQQNPPGRFPPANPNDLHEEIQRLNYLLEMERAGRDQTLAHLEAELHSKTLRQQDLEELKVAHLLSQEAFVAEVQAEKKKSEALQEQLDQLQTSFEELRSKYQADDALVRQEAETQKFHEPRQSEEQRLLENLRAEKDQMFHEMSQKIAFLEDSEKLLQEELTQLRRSYNELNSKYESDISILKHDVEKYQEEVKHEKDANIEREKQNLQLINKLRAEKEELSQNMSEEITIWQKREKLMFHELDQVHASHEELKCKYEAEILDLQKQVETHQRQIKEERKDCLERIEENMVLLDTMRAEKEELFQNMSEEIAILQKREKLIVSELDQIPIFYKELKWRYEREILDLQQQVETHQRQVKEERKDCLERIEEDMVLLDKLRAEYVILQENTTTEIKFLQDKDRSAQAELEQINGLYQELNCRYKTDVTALKQQAETYQQEISCLKNDLERAREDFLLEDLDNPETKTTQDGGAARCNQ
ncbi:trichohyalin-like [Gambusia affinis]|uniref:trichohyalin-like n=1 Tax=Gambusia affinis TaxID=33528 RepID=UPI001CDC34D8|nr:trichohyalin-like [Gambusia affinis]